MKLFIKLILLISLLANFWYTKADIDLIVSPIKYEIQAKPWETITKEAKLINKSDKQLKIYTWKSDFEAESNTGKPNFKEKDELQNPWTSIVDWIDIETWYFTIEAKEEKVILFDIEIPEDATPGWHYWAVFFKNYWKENYDNTGDIVVDIDYWVLVLVNVEWEVINIGSPLETQIKSWGLSWHEYQLQNKTDNCKLVDLTDSNIDGKCIDLSAIEKDLLSIISKITKSEEEKTDEELKNDNDFIIEDLENIINKEDEEFSIEFEIPFENKWNTHIKPEWKITLVDEKWNVLKWIWKEIIKNEAWTIVWEKIVDYIPINDIWWNVLPNTNRVFESEWKWFPYEAYDEQWKKVIKYWTPWEFYTMENIYNKNYIYPWEREVEKLEQKKIKAIIDLWYKNYLDEEVEFNSAKEFTVEYKTKKIELNPFFFIYLFTWLIFIYFIFIIIRKVRKKKCSSCKEYINKKMKICPYCWEKQKEKKKKK